MTSAVRLANGPPARVGTVARLALVAGALLALAACSGPTVPVSLNLITESCGSGADFLFNTSAQTLTFTVFGGNLSQPLQTTANVSSQTATVAKIPLGTSVDIVVQAFDSSSTLVARGESGPVTIQSGGTNTINIYVWPTDTFQYVNSTTSLNTCNALGSEGTLTPGPGRAAHTATLLENGSVLLAGGLFEASDGGVTYLDTTEIYNPATGTLTEGPTLEPARAFHTATHIAGTPYTLIAGGENNTIGAVKSAELYDEQTNMFTSFVMTPGRTRHTAVLTPNNQVLLIGGYTGSQLSQMTLLNTAEIFDETANPPAFLDSGVIFQNGLAEAGAVYLTSNDSIAVVGGVTASGTTTAPATQGFFLDQNGMGTFSLRDGLVLKDPHVFPLLGVLGNGSELAVAGGFQEPATAPDGQPQEPSKVSEFFNGDSPTLTLGPGLTDPRGWGASVMLPDGSMLVSGGRESTSTGVSSSADHFLLNLSGGADGGALTGPALIAAQPAGQPQQARYLHQLTVLPDSSVLVSGGMMITASGATQMVTKLEVYEPPYVASGTNPHSNIQGGSTSGGDE